MKQRLKIAGYITIAFASCGFFICWILLGYSTYATARGFEPNQKAMLTLCPASMLTLGLDDASVLVRILGWLLISFMNGVRYAVPGLVIGVPIAVIYPKNLLSRSKS